jgi:hypothetical protein
MTLSWFPIFFCRSGVGIGIGIEFGVSLILG